MKRRSFLLNVMCRRLISLLHLAIIIAPLTGCWRDSSPLVPLAPEAAPPQSVSIDYADADIRELLNVLAPHFHLKLDLPPDLRGRTSIKLRDVTWRQIFSVILSPLDYGFIEENGTVIIRTNEKIAALPPVSKTVMIRHRPPLDAAAYLNRIFRDKATFTPTRHGLAYDVSRKMQQAVHDEILRIDAPDVVLNWFPKTPRLPAELPPLAPVESHQWAVDPGAVDALTTRIYLFEHIDAELAAPYLKKVASGKNDRVVFDVRNNALIVTAPESRRPQMAAIAAYLDDLRWYADGSELALPPKPHSQPMQ